MKVRMEQLLELVVTENCSDLHIRVGLPPVVRLHGSLVVLTQVPPVSQEDAERLVKSITSEEHLRRTREVGGSDFGFSYQDKARFRVSIFKERGNFALVMRQIPTKMMTLEQIGLPPGIKDLLYLPRGLILVVGPTGSGKTTTLYAMLAEMNQTSVNISTIEDPIELRLDGISQSQVAPGIDVTFASMLRALLRQDPDIMLVGEIRDLETAKIACEAALTGHLVLATLHTNSAPDAITRLTEIGIQPHLLAPAVIGVLGQRLARRLCEHCKEPYKPAESVLRRHFSDEVLPEVTFYRGRGCRVCQQTGFRGRVSFHELVILGREMRSLIISRASPDTVLKAAQRLGYKPLRYDGLKKVLLGLTTIEEIEAQTPLEFE